MSMCYWMCEGIGVRTNKLLPHLNADKCIKLIKNEFGDEFINNEKEFNINDYIHGEPFENLAIMLCHCDDTNVLTCRDAENDEYFLCYTPSYPWERRTNEPTSIEEVREIIKDAVQRICNLTREEIETMIDDDIFEYRRG